MALVLHIMSQTLTSSLGMVFASSKDSRDRKGPIIVNTLASASAILEDILGALLKLKKVYKVYK